MTGGAEFTRLSSCPGVRKILSNGNRVRAKILCLPDFVVDFGWRFPNKPRPLTPIELSHRLALTVILFGRATAPMHLRFFSPDAIRPSALLSLR